MNKRYTDSELREIFKHAREDGIAAGSSVTKARKALAIELTYA